MTITIPEDIVPSTLEAFTPDDFIDVAAGALPNGDDAMVYTGASGCAGLRFSQPVRLDSHFMANSPAVNSLSFWIRRKQAWTLNLSDPGNSSAGNTGAVPNNIIMGVGSPLGNSNVDDQNFLSWALCAVGTVQISFGIKLLQSSTPAYFWTGAVTLATDTWHLITVTLTAYTSGSGDPRPVLSIYRDGVLQGSNQPSIISYIIMPRSIVGLDIANFALGCPTAVDAAVVGAAASPILDIGKIAFHNRILSGADMLGLINSMYFGG